MVATANTSGIGASVYVPAGSNCYMTGPLTTFTVPTTIYGDGPCANNPNDGCISQISLENATADAIKITGFSGSVHDIGIVNWSDTTPTAGAAINFCPAAAGTDSTFHVNNVSVNQFYVGVKSCEDEGSTITNSFFDVIYDAILMAGETPYNGGDFYIAGNLAFATGTPANAFVDLAGQGAGRISGNKAVDGSSGTYNYDVYCETVGGATGCFNLVITHNDFENAQIEAVNLTETGGAPNTFLTIANNQLLYQATSGPLVTIAGANGVYFGGNTVSNATTTASPEVILFTGISEASDVEPQSGQSLRQREPEASRAAATNSR